MNTTLVQIEAKDSSAIRCGGTLCRVAMPQNYQDIEDFCIKYYGEEKIIVGALSNTLVLSGGVSKLAISTKMLRGFRVENDIIEAYSGEKLAKIAQIAQYYCLSGMENICGIPGSVGGAVFGNSGSFGSNMGDIVESIKIIDLDSGNISELHREEIGFFYRRTNLRKNKDFVYSVKLRLYPDRCNNIALKMNDVKQKRLSLQPSKPSLGSVFRRCDDTGAGYYLEQAGLKGFERGGMSFSDMHANFIVNSGGNAEDYLYLVELGERKVFEKFGKKLLREVNIIGEPPNKEFNRERTYRH